MIKKPDKIIRVKEEEIENLLTVITILKMFGPMMGYYEDAKKALGDKIKEFDNESSVNNIRLFILSWLTFPFAEITRYPNNKINPFDMSEENLNHIKFIEDLLDLISESIEYMEGYESNPPKHPKSSHQ